MLPTGKGKSSERTNSDRGTYDKGIGETGGQRSGRLGSTAVFKVWESRHRLAMGRKGAEKEASHRGNGSEMNGAESTLTGSRKR